MATKKTVPVKRVLALRPRKLPCLEVTQGIHTFYLTKIDASTVTRISYAAVRRQSEEEGAVQRVLNTERISHIKRFVIEGGNFPNAMVLNWVSQDEPLSFSEGILTLPNIPLSAQIIDGQHRISGIRAAIGEVEELGKLELPVVIYVGLSTQQCADIFLAINTEQKPVPPSLVYDLYGVASEEMVDIAAVRARDIVGRSRYAAGAAEPGSIQNMTSPLSRDCSITNFEVILIWKQLPTQFSNPTTSCICST